MSPADYSAELARLAKVNDVPLRELEDSAFAMRARVWRERRQVVLDEDLLDALKIGIAADFAKREGEQPEPVEPRTLALAPIAVSQVQLPRVGWHLAPRWGKPTTRSLPARVRGLAYLCRHERHPGGMPLHDEQTFTVTDEETPVGTGDRKALLAWFHRTRESAVPAPAHGPGEELTLRDGQE